MDGHLGFFEAFGEGGGQHPGGVPCPVYLYLTIMNRGSPPTMTALELWSTLCLEETARTRGR